MDRDQEALKAIEAAAGPHKKCLFENCFRNNEDCDDKLFNTWKIYKRKITGKEKAVLVGLNIVINHKSIKLNVP